MPNSQYRGLTSVASQSVPVSPAETRTNTLFAFEPEPGKPFANPFVGTRRITLPWAAGTHSGVEVVAGIGASVEIFQDESTGCCAYCWGRPAHPDIPRADLLKWIASVATGEDISPLKFLVGTFVVLIDDRRNRRVHFVSDVLGLRPWFVGKRQGRLICGSDVWELCNAGIDMGGVNYDAVASWLRFGWDCSGQSLFNGFSAMGYGVVATYNGGTYAEKRYFSLTGGLKPIALPEMIDGIHQRVSRTFDATTRDLNVVTIALSGGYDSRYLAALASRRKDLDVEAFCVGDREAEGIAASRVAAALGLKLNVLSTDGALWNMFAEPYHFTPGGFPITKQLSHLAASQRPGIPFLSGFFGDPIVRGSQDRQEGKLERETAEDLALVYRRVFTLKHNRARFDLLDSDILKRSDERILNMLRQRINVWAHTQHAFLGLSLFLQQRLYMANNVVQLLHVTDPILPFVSWESIEYKMQNDPSGYGYEAYGKLLATIFPEIGDIPHNSAMGAKNDLDPRPSRCTKQWASAVFKAIVRSDSLPLISRRKAIPRLVGAVVGRRDLDVVAMFLYRLHLLDSRLRRAHVQFDWNQI